MMRRSLIRTFAIIICLCLLLSSCRQHKKIYRFYTGGTEGTYYQYGTVLAEVIKERTNIRLEVITSGGSKDNIHAIETGQAQFGFVQSDVMTYASGGTNAFASSGHIENFSVVAAMYNEPVQIVTFDPDIQSVSDLKAKRVSIGAKGSGVNFNAKDILKAYDMTLEDIVPVYENFAKSVSDLINRQIDAAIIVAGIPTDAISKMTRNSGFHLIGLDQDHIDIITHNNPYYRSSVIPSAIYQLADDLTTVSVQAVLIARDDVPDQEVYNIVSAIFNNSEEIAEKNLKGRNLDLYFAASVQTVLYHPGAARFYREKGLNVIAKLD